MRSELGVLLGVVSRDVGVSWVNSFMPQADGRLSLEEVYVLFEEDFGVKKSERMWQEKHLAQEHIA